MNTMFRIKRVIYETTQIEASCTGYDELVNLEDQLRPFPLTNGIVQMSLLIVLINRLHSCRNNARKPSWQ